MSTRVINVRHEPWASSPTSYHYVGRARRVGGIDRDGLFGNPFTARTPETLKKYREWLVARLKADAVYLEMCRVIISDSMPLGCFCVDEDGLGACHGKVLADVVGSWDKKK